MILAAPAHAQDSGDGDDFEQVDGITEQENAGVGLSTITVTANRREESLQDVSVPVNAIDGDALLNRGIVATEDLSSAVPALQVQPAGGSGLSLFVRGVGTRSGNSFAENAVAFNFNDVYLARPTSVGGTFFDLERVEVLKGPQGTLYGRNATGGAVNVIPKRPELGAVGGSFTASYGNYDHVLVSGAINVPLGDTLAIRAAGQISERDGYLSDGTSDESVQAGRLSVLFEPSDLFSVTIVGDYSHQGGKGTGSVIIPSASGAYDAPPLEDRVGATDPRARAVPISVAAGSFAPPYCGGFGGFVTSGCVMVAGDLGEPSLDSENYGISANFEADLGFATLNVIPAWRQASSDYVSYVPGFLLDVTDDSEQISLETRLSSNSDGPFEYVVGAYYFKEEQSAINRFSQGTLATTLFTPELETESFALFGQASFALSDTFRLIGGLRWTDEDKTQVTSLGRGDPSLPDPYNPPLTRQFTGEQGFEKLTWKAGFEFDVGMDSLLYGNVATGIKSGGFFVAAPPDNTFEPEELTAYTVGIKNRFLNDRLQLNVEAFYWDYKDQQISFVGAVVDDTTGELVNTGLTRNAGQAEMYGIELDGLFQLSPFDLFSFNVQWLESEYKDFEVALFGPTPVLPPTSCQILETQARPGGFLFPTQCAGNPALSSPRWTFNLGYEHTFELGSGLELIAGAQTTIESSRYLDVDFSEESLQDSSMKSDAFLTLESIDDGWSLTAFINNIEDEEILASSGTRPILNIKYGALRPPRTYGLRATKRF
ncbi:TonB-dependent receptor [Aurantiacibacter odishensis]|uniref:TonB-dependent receptor n=1 Tax=Aurantiacibacter odishensis TaxID=1155476 RepID=UPI001F0C80DA|nr:TonB-dependent receptor [Aurantiacibacter odishensis]